MATPQAVTVRVCFVRASVDQQGFSNCVTHRAGRATKEKNMHCAHSRRLLLCCSHLAISKRGAHSGRIVSARALSMTMSTTTAQSWHNVLGKASYVFYLQVHFIVFLRSKLAQLHNKSTSAGVWVGSAPPPPPTAFANTNAHMTGLEHAAHATSEGMILLAKHVCTS